MALFETLRFVLRLDQFMGQTKPADLRSSFFQFVRATHVGSTGGCGWLLVDSAWLWGGGLLKCIVVDGGILDKSLEMNPRARTMRLCYLSCGALSVFNLHSLEQRSQSEVPYSNVDVPH